MCIKKNNLLPKSISVAKKAHKMDKDKDDVYADRKFTLRAFSELIDMTQLTRESTEEDFKKLLRLGRKLKLEKAVDYVDKMDGKK